jgi:hypothetical protein
MVLQQLAWVQMFATVMLNFLHGAAQVRLLYNYPRLGPQYLPDTLAE